MPQVILVGVDNTDRYRDLRPLKPDGSAGGTEKFSQYFREELIPFVDQQYRTVDYRILAGVQAGACFGLYTLMEQPDLFQAYILDNSFDNPQVVDDYLLNKAKAFFSAEQSTRKYLYMKVDQGSTNLPVALEEKKIIESGMPKGFRFEFRLSDAVENFIFETNFGDGCTKLFQAYNPPADYSLNGLDDILKYYADYSDRMGFTVNIPERLFAEVGDALGRQQKTEQVQRLWDYVLRENPNSLDGLFQLGQLNYALGNYEKAKEYFQRFLEIRPQEAMIRNRLNQIDKLINE